MTNLIIPVYKPTAKTPLQVITALRLKNPLLETAKLGYAGKLDPMAQGVQLVLQDSANQDVEHYKHLPKTYEFSILLGLKTDSYDNLGIIQAIELKNQPDVSQVISKIESWQGPQIQVYPPFSGVKVNGKPLFYWTKQQIQITPPTHPITIFSSQVLEVGTITCQELLSQSTSWIEQLTGEFRQVEVLSNWSSNLTKLSHKFVRLDVRIECSSGTYVRQLVHELGTAIDFPTMTWNITRTSVGDYQIKDCISVF